MRFLKETFDKDAYLEYLEKHIRGVQKSYKLLIDNKIIKRTNELDKQISEHDKSKYDTEEFNAYGEKFYGTPDEIAFKYAWLHHQHNNPHHWQYWCLLEDEGGKKPEPLEMPYNYVIEMICDWLSFSINKGDLSEIQNWYKDNKNNQLLHKETRKLVEEILDKLKGIKNNEIYS